MDDLKSDRWVPMRFNIDGGKEYPGFSRGGRWNGWEMPFFTFEVAQELMNDQNAATKEQQLVYEAATDSFVYQDSYYPADEWERFDAVLVDGQKFYAIGAGSWVWDGSPIKQ